MMWSLCCKVANHDVNDFNSLNEMFPAYKKFIHDGQHSKEIEKMILRLLTLLSWQNDIGDNSSTSPIAAKSLIQVSQDLVNVLLLPKEVKNCIIIAILSHRNSFFGDFILLSFSLPAGRPAVFENNSKKIS